MLERFSGPGTEQLRKLFREQSLINLRRLKAQENRHYRVDRNDTLTVVINQGCRLGCSSCFRTLEEKREIDAGLLHRVADYAARHFHSLSLTGGEPTDSIPLIVETARKHPDLRINVTTNGEEINDAVFRSLSTAPNIFPVLSLNGIGNRHDASRHPGSFQQLMTTVDCLRKLQIPFGVLTVINGTNISQLLTGELAGFIDAIGACSLEFLQYYPIGTRDHTCSELPLTSRQIDESLTYRDTLEGENRYSFSYRSSQSGGKRCQRALQVFIDGEISYCPFSVWGFDRIKSDDTDDMIRSKFDHHFKQWTVLTAESPSFCPLQSNTKGYVDFFSRNGTRLYEPTGILDVKSPAHETYCNTAGASQILNRKPGECSNFNRG